MAWSIRILGANWRYFVPDKILVIKPHGQSVTGLTLFRKLWIIPSRNYQSTKNKNAIFIFLHFQPHMWLKMAAHPCAARKLWINQSFLYFSAVDWRCNNYPSFYVRLRAIRGLVTSVFICVHLWMLLLIICVYLRVFADWFLCVLYGNHLNIYPLDVGKTQFLFTAFLLQACGGQTTRANADTPENGQQLSDQAFTDIDKNNQVNAITNQIKTLKLEQRTAPETQIIRELYDAGCLIEDFELDRRKQNMRISCAKNIIYDNSRI